MANPEFDIRRSVLVGDTADIYLQRTLTILRNESVNPVVSMEFAPGRAGVICGIMEARALLAKILPEASSEVWALDEGDAVEAQEVAMRVKAPYGSIGLYETAIAGILASSTAWATAARECVDAAQDVPVVALGAGHIHPDVAATLEYSAVVGGCVSCSTPMGARLAGVTPSGGMPHALALVLGDSVKAIQAFDRHMPQEIPRVALVDTFRDEAEDGLNVAKALKEKLRGIRIGTSRERGGVTPPLVKEVRARLDLAGFKHVEIFISGGLTPERIGGFMDSETPADGFLVGSYLANAAPNDFSADIHEIDRKPVAKRGRIPGVTSNPRLGRVI